jgi:hypothetical protein
MSDKLNRYKIYLYSEPHFLILTDESIIDINLKSNLKKKKLEIYYDDNFFDFNLKSSKKSEWLVTIQSFDLKDKFIYQIDLHGESIKIGNKKSKNFLSLIYDQISNNNGWASIPPLFEQAELEYTRSRFSYLRNLKLNLILD